MSTKTKFIDKQGSTLQRLPLQAGRMFFTREILLDSIRFCQANQGLMGARLGADDEPSAHDLFLQTRQ